MKKATLLLLMMCSALYAQQTMTNLDLQFKGELRDTLGKTYGVDSLTGGATLNIELINYTRPNNLGYLDCQYDSIAEIVLFQTDTIKLCVFWGRNNYNVADTLFCVSNEAEIDSETDSIIKRYHIAQISHYSTPTADVNNFFNFKLAETGVYYVPDDYATINAAVPAMATDDTLYVKTHTESLANRAMTAKNIIGVGDVKVTNSGTSYLFLVGSGAVKSSVQGIEVEQPFDRYLSLTQGGSFIVENVFMSNGSRVHNETGNGDSIYYRKCNLNHGAASNQTFSLRASDVIIEDCNIRNNVNRCVSIATTTGGKVDFKRNILKGFTSAVFLESNRDTVNIVANSVDSLNQLLETGATINPEYCKMWSNKGFVDAARYQIQKATVGTFDVKYNNLTSTSINIMLRVFNSSLYYYNNYSDKTGATTIRMESDSVVTGRIYNNKFYLREGAEGVNISDSLYLDEIDFKYYNNYMNTLSGSNIHGIQVYNITDAMIRKSTFINSSAVFKSNGYDYQNAIMDSLLVIGGTVLIKGVDSSLVENCTVYNDENSTGQACLRYFNNFAGTCVGNTARNNILVHLTNKTAGACIEIKDGADVILEYPESNYNVFQSNTDTIIKDGSSYYDFTTWQGLGYDANSYESDPNFKDAPNDLRVVAPSDAIGNSTTGNTIGALGAILFQRLKIRMQDYGAKLKDYE